MGVVRRFRTVKEVNSIWVSNKYVHFTSQHCARRYRKGFGYTINRDRCVLKDGVYWGEGNRELQPHGHMVEVWAENAQNVTLDCGGRSIGKNIFTADRHAGEHVTVVGSVSIHGVVMRRRGRVSSHTTHVFSSRT